MRITVIDAGVALKTVIPDPLTDTCRFLLARLGKEGFELLAPSLWAYETTSTLTKTIHLGRMTVAQGRAALAQLEEIKVRLCSPDSAQARQAFEWTLQLRRAAAYDSFYLALAQSLQCDLWTTDQRLVNSAAAAHPWIRSVAEQA